MPKNGFIPSAANVSKQKDEISISDKRSVRMSYQTSHIMYSSIDPLHCKLKKGLLQGQYNLKRVNI